MIPQPLENLIKQLSKLPGLGPRSAQRVALDLVSNGEQLYNLQQSLIEVAGQVTNCESCGNIGLASPCHICTDTSRDNQTICVVEGVDDLWALERSGSFKGFYHVLGGVVSALDGVGPDDLRIPALVQRVKEGDIQEVILALGASVDGQTTAHLLARRIKGLNKNVEVTMLAKGIPVGAEVDYLDDGTLALALEGRKQF